MLDYQTVLILLGLVALLAVAFMVLVRPNAARSRYGKRGLGQTGRAGSVRRPETAPVEMPAARPDEEAPRERRA